MSPHQSLSTKRVSPRKEQEKASIYCYIPGESDVIACLPHGYNEYAKSSGTNCMRQLCHTPYTDRINCFRRYILKNTKRNQLDTNDPQMDNISSHIMALRVPEGAMGLELNGRLEYVAQV